MNCVVLKKATICY